jgi:SagB-type dehydrogenase family enzyme
MDEKINLPAPDTEGDISLEEAIARRKSVRRFSPQALSLSQLSQVLWAADGLRNPSSRYRTVPSAGATYPLEIFVVCGWDGVEGVNAGVYRYDISGHFLSLHVDGDARIELAKAALDQEFLLQAPATMVVCAEYERTALRYGDRAERYINVEVGHAGQNIYLQAAAMGLGTVAVGAFYDEAVGKALRLDNRFRPLYIMPIGKPV